MECCEILGIIQREINEDFTTLKINTRTTVNCTEVLQKCSTPDILFKII